MSSNSSRRDNFLSSLRNRRSLNKPCIYFQGCPIVFRKFPICRSNASSSDQPTFSVFRLNSSETYLCPWLKTTLFGLRNRDIVRWHTTIVINHPTQRLFPTPRPTACINQSTFRIGYDAIQIVASKNWLPGQRCVRMFYITYAVQLMISRRL